MDLATRRAMLRVLAVLALLFAVMDHWTTWLCLRAPVPGWEVIEGNPLAAWLFGRVGLVEGLWLDSVVTLLAVALVAHTKRLGRPLKLALLGLLVCTSAFAVANNFEVIRRIGVSASAGIG
jgi:hypothetical protein